MSLFQPATRQQRKLRLALIGPSGSGKTYTALLLAQALGKRIAVIDTERGSASAYADRFAFDTLQLTSFSPERYLEGIKAASGAGYDALIIDSLSHAWSGKDGILEFVDKVAARSRSGNSFAAWREATPVHNSLVDGMLDADCHVIVTMRAKTEYVQEKDERTGKTSVRKVGMQPVQRDGLEYEFDITADLDWSNQLVVSKTRCAALQGYVAKPAGDEFAGIIRDWLSSGAAPAQAETHKMTPAVKSDAPPLALGQQSGVDTGPITPSQAKAIAAALKPLKLDKDEARMLVESILDRELVDGVMSMTSEEGARLAEFSTDQWAVAADSFRVPA